MEILSRELSDVTMENVTKSGPGSEFIEGHAKDTIAKEARA